MIDLDTLEYPRHVHKPSYDGQWVYLSVRDADACGAALRDGWSLTPILIDPAPPSPAVSPAPVPVPEPKRRGRPRKDAA